MLLRLFESIRGHFLSRESNGVYGFFCFRTALPPIPGFAIILCRLSWILCHILCQWTLCSPKHFRRGKRRKAGGPRFVPQAANIAGVSLTDRALRGSAFAPIETTKPLQSLTRKWSGIRPSRNAAAFLAASWLFALTGGGSVTAAVKGRLRLLL